MKMYTIEKRINNTTIYCKVPYDALSQRQLQQLICYIDNRLQTTTRTTSRSRTRIRFRKQYNIKNRLN